MRALAAAGPAVAVGAPQPPAPAGPLTPSLLVTSFGLKRQIRSVVLKEQRQTSQLSRKDVDLGGMPPTFQGGLLRPRLNTGVNGGKSLQEIPKPRGSCLIIVEEKPLCTSA